MSLDSLLSGRKQMVRWTREEINMIAEETVNQIIENPSCSLHYLANEAQAKLLKRTTNSFTPDRVRHIQGKTQADILLPRIKELLANMQEKAFFCEDTEVKLASRLTKEEILDGLTLEEKIRLFQEDILNNITYKDYLDRVHHKDK